MNLTAYEIGSLLSRANENHFTLVDSVVDTFLKNNLIYVTENKRFGKTWYSMTKKGKDLCGYLEKQVSNFFFVPSEPFEMDTNISYINPEPAPVIETEAIADLIIEMVEEDAVISKYQEEVPCDEYGCEEL